MVGPNRRADSASCAPHILPVPPDAYPRARLYLTRHRYTRAAVAPLPGATLDHPMGIGFLDIRRAVN